MILVKPAHVFFDEMTGNCEDCLMFELRSLPGVGKVTSSIITHFSLASEVSANLFRHVLGETSEGLMDAFLR